MIKRRVTKKALSNPLPPSADAVPILKPVKLHLGCGYKRIPSTPTETWINVDKYPECSTPDIVCDSVDLDCPDNYADEIFSNHMIEHISHRRILDAFKNWARILKPGGKLVIECPNLTAAVQKWMNIPDFGRGSTYETIFGGQEGPGAYHISGYSYELLESLLKEAGFKEVKREIPTFGIEYGEDWNLRVVAVK